MTKWKTLLQSCMQEHGEELKDVVSYAPVDGKWLDYFFDDDSKFIEGEIFTVWTKSRVYFPVQYNGSEWVESVSRNPDGKPTHHIGG